MSDDRQAKAAARAEAAFKRQEIAKAAVQEAEAAVIERDANTARLKALRLERDRVEAESAPSAPPAKAAARRKRVVRG